MKNKSLLANYHNKLLSSFIAFSIALLPYYSSFAEGDAAQPTQNLPQIADNANANKSAASALENAINDYKQLAANSGWEKFPVGKTIKVSGHDGRIPTLRQILSVMGDYKGEMNLSSNVLDSNLSEAVKKFQIRHGLEADGAVGKKTQIQLAVPVTERIAQMEVALEKMREMPDLGDRYILVNLPGFYLQAVENRQPVLTSRIIVGNPRNSTPQFIREINSVSFNPLWHVPDRIAREEFIGKLRKDPDYLRKGNYMVVSNKGNRVDADSIDWNSHSGSLPYRFVQRSGSSNALGKLKFNLPDTNSIYLHSTGSPKLFAKAERALSHGCIRVEKVLELAYFVMKGMADWNEEKINNMYSGSNSKIVSVSPVPVYVAYWTSWVDAETRQPHFHPDIYGRDKKRVAELLDGQNKNSKPEMKLAMQ